MNALSSNIYSSEQELLDEYPSAKPLQPEQELIRTRGVTPKVVLFLLVLLPVLFGAFSDLVGALIVLGVSCVPIAFICLQPKKLAVYISHQTNSLQQTLKQAQFYDIYALNSAADMRSCMKNKLGTYIMACLFFGGGFAVVPAMHTTSYSYYALTGFAMHKSGGAATTTSYHALTGLAVALGLGLMCISNFLNANRASQSNQVADPGPPR